VANPTGGENRSTPNPGNRAGFTAEQLRNAAIIAGVGQSLGISAQGIQIAIMTGLVESGLRNVNYGDRDSLGVFQQRGPWGSRSQRLNVAASAKMFFTGGAGGQRGLMDIHGWQNLDLGSVAQAVQVSAFPGRYAQRQDDAGRLMSAAGSTPYTTQATQTGASGKDHTSAGLFTPPPALGLGQQNPTATMQDPMSSAMDKLLGTKPGASDAGSTAAGVNAPTDALGIQAADKAVRYPDAPASTASFTQPASLAGASWNQGGSVADSGVTGVRSQAINMAKSQIGVPYSFGAASWGQGLDCSSLVQGALQRAGIKNAPRLAAQQAAWGKQVPINQLKPGDLVSYSNGGQVDHIVLYLGGGKVIEEPRPGLSVRVRSLGGSWDNSHHMTGISLAQYYGN